MGPGVGLQEPAENKACFSDVVTSNFENKVIVIGSYHRCGLNHNDETVM